jgi:predicted small secreted protein
MHNENNSKRSELINSQIDPINTCFLLPQQKKTMVEVATPSSTQAEVVLVGKLRCENRAFSTSIVIHAVLMFSCLLCSTLLTGCGMPLRGMGWYHAVQMLGGECPSAKLCHIIEPWFLGPGASG